VKFRIKKEELVEVVSRGGMPIKADPMINTSYKGYGNISFSEGRLTVVSSGPTVCARSSVAVEDMVAVEGSATLSLEHMQQILKFFPKNDEVLIEKVVTEGDPNGILHIKSGKMKLCLQCIHNKMFSDFEEPSPIVPPLVLDAEQVVAAMSRVSSFPSTHDANGVYNNLAFRGNGQKLYVGGGDERMIGYTAVCDMEIPVKPFFLPTPLIKAAMKFLVPGTLSVIVDGAKVFFKQEHACFRACLLEGMDRRTRDYTSLSLKKMEAALSISFEKFLDIVQACSYVNASESMVRVRDGALHLTAAGEQGANFSGSMEYASPTVSEMPEYDFAIPPVLMMEFVKKCTSDVKVDFSFQRSEGREKWPSYISMTSGEFMAFIQSSSVAQARYG
jgi:DNA polymerase III sliding clamp (beta) subunit (PCNA family)